jgi:hypothetical protein
MKLQPGLKPEYVKQYEGDTFNTIISVEIDSQGTMYTAGYFDDTMDGNPSPDEISEITNSGNGVYEAFVNVLDNSGQYAYTLQAGGVALVLTQDILALKDNTLYISPSFEGTVDTDFTEETLSQTSEGIMDFFINKISIDPLNVNTPTAISVVVAPNPADKMIAIHGLEKEPYQYHIYDILGKLVKQGTLPVTTREIQIGHLPSGLYLLRFDRGASVKFIKK